MSDENKGKKMEQKDIKKMKKAELVEFIEKEAQSRQEHLGELLAWMVAIYNFLVGEGSIDNENSPDVVEYDSEKMLELLKGIRASSETLAETLGVDLYSEDQGGEETQEGTDASA